MLEEIIIKRNFNLGTGYRLVKSLIFLGVIIFCSFAFGFQGATKTGLVMIGSLVLFGCLTLVVNIRRFLNRTVLCLTCQGIYHRTAKGELKQVLIPYDEVKCALWLEEKRQSYIFLIVPTKLSQQFYVDYEKFDDLSAQNFLAGQNKLKQANIDLARHAIAINLTGISVKSQTLLADYLTKQHIPYLSDFNNFH